MRRRFICKIATYTQIWYDSIDSNIVTPALSSVFGANIVSNTYSGGKGVIKFDGDVKTIGDSAFYDCRSLKSITIPNSVVSIGSQAFSYCTSLESITIPDSVTSIEWYAFAGCESLISVTIPDSVMTIRYHAFSDCYSLTEFKGKFAEDNGRILVIDGVLVAFAPAGLTEYAIPDSVTTIGDGAFANCDNLTSITIPDSVISIGMAAFYDCNSLTSVYCKATTPPILGDNYVFDNNGSGRKIYVPYQSLDAYKTATNWSKYADDIVGYDFENDKVIITFTVNGTEYQAEEGMTWEEWCNSGYNVDRFRSYLHTAVFTYDGGAIVQGQTPSDVICNGCEYITISAT